MERNRGDGSRSNQVYEALVELVRAGKLRPGERVREEEYATLLKVSRTPVREALVRLQASGLLEPSPAGLTVAALSRPQVIELYAIRAELEAAAAGFAAENASPGEIAGLRHAAALFNINNGDALEIARANTLFHEAIYEGAHNRYLLGMLGKLNDSLALLPNTTFAVPGRFQSAEIEHRAILCAVEKRDVAAAKQSARSHIEQALEGRLKLLFSVAAVG